MTEREKMARGLLYDPFSEGMPEARARAHRLCLLYNGTTETDVQRREEILRELMPRRGEGVYLQGPIYFDFGTNLVMGDGSYANFNFTVLDEGLVTIGRCVFIGPNVSLLTPVHPLCYQDRDSFVHPETGCVTNLEYAKPITIGDHCWLGGNVTVCGGVTIGEGCVIGAGSVVTRDIPPHTLAYGNPCRAARPITEADRDPECRRIIGR